MRKLILLVLIFIFHNNFVKADYSDESFLPFLKFSEIKNTIKYPILSPLKDGPLKVLFIGQSASAGVVCFETAKRMDISFETILTESRKTLGTKTNNGSYFSSALSDSSVSKNILDSLEKEWDVIYFDFDFSALPDKIKIVLESKISGGAGLVYAGEKSEIGSLKIGGKVDKGPVNPDTFYSFTDFFAGNCGNGTVAVIPPPKPFMNIQSLTNYFNSAADIIHFASSKRKDLYITNIEFPSKPVEHEAMNILHYRIFLKNSSAQDSMQIIEKFRDENNKIVEEISGTYLVNPGNSFIWIAYPVLPEGKYSVDVSVVSSGGVCASAGNILNVKTTERITDVKIWKTSAAVGDFFTGTIQASFEFKEGIYLTVELLDSFGRSIEKNTLETVIGRKSADFIFKINKAVTKSMFVKTELFRNNELSQSIIRDVYVSDYSNPKQFFFGVFDSSGIGFNDSEKYKILSEAGVNAVSPDFSQINNPNIINSVFSEILSDNIVVYPRFSVVSEQEDLSRIINNNVSVIKSIQNYGVSGFLLDFGNFFRKKGSLISFENFDYQKPAGFDSLFSIGITGFPPEFFTAKENPGFEGFKKDFNVSLLNTIKENYSLSKNSLSLMADDKGRKGIVVSPGPDIAGNIDFLHSAPWICLFENIDFLWWGKMFGGAGSALTPSCSAAPYFSIISAESKEIMSGIDLLYYGIKNSGKTLFSGTTVNNASFTVNNIKITSQSGEPLNGIYLKVAEDINAEYIGIALMNKNKPEKMKIMLNLPAELINKYVYDVRKKVFLGTSNNISIEIQNGKPELIAFLPYRVMSLNIEFTNSIVGKGENFEFTARIVPNEKRKENIRHVFRVEIIDPEDNEKPVITDVFDAENGYLKKSYKMINFLKPGRWLLRVCDIASGKQTEKAFMIMEKIK